MPLVLAGVAVILLTAVGGGIFAWMRSPSPGDTAAAGRSSITANGAKSDGASGFEFAEDLKIVVLATDPADVKKTKIEQLERAQQAFEQSSPEQRLNYLSQLKEGFHTDDRDQRRCFYRMLLALTKDGNAEAFDAVWDSPLRKYMLEELAQQDSVPAQLKPAAMKRLQEMMQQDYDKPYSSDPDVDRHLRTIVRTLGADADEISALQRPMLIKTLRNSSQRVRSGEGRTRIYYVIAKSGSDEGLTVEELVEALESHPWDYTDRVAQLVEGRGPGNVLGGPFPEVGGRSGSRRQTAATVKSPISPIGDVADATGLWAAEGLLRRGNEARAAIPQLKKFAAGAAEAPANLREEAKSDESAEICVTTIETIGRTSNSYKRLPKKQAQAFIKEKFEPSARDLADLGVSRDRVKSYYRGYDKVLTDRLHEVARKKFALADRIEKVLKAVAALPDAP